MSSLATASALVRACHPEPTAAVTALAGMLTFRAGNDAFTVGWAVLAVLTGQLSIGWSNDLVDATRDRAIGRTDKPLATGRLDEHTVRVALAAAVIVCVAASLILGFAAAVAHLVLVSCGWAYNLKLKKTAWSWLPFAIAFGLMPAIAWLALDPPSMPPAWMMAAGALLGVGAHLLNVIPDLDDDTATGVHGMPHRLGQRRAQALAIGILCVASVIAVIGPAGHLQIWVWFGLGVVAVLAVTGWRGTGRWPFRAALGIAAIDVIILVIRE